MSATCLTAILLLCQQTSEIPGSYRGPAYEALTAEAAAQSDEPTDSIAALEAHERWEFWFEHNREDLLRGPSEAPYFSGEGAARDTEGALSLNTIAEEGMPYLFEALQHADPAVREAAAISLGRIGMTVARPRLLDSLTDPSQAVRQAAWLGLGLLGDPRSLVELADRFNNTKLPPSERALAAIALGFSRSNEARTQLRRYLVTNLKPDRMGTAEEVVLHGALWGAGALGSSSLVPALTGAESKLRNRAPSASRRTRTILLHALGRIGDPAARPTLVRGLLRKDKAIARASALALGLLGDPGAAQALAKAMTTSGDPQTQSFAAISLGRLNTKEARKALLDNYEDSRATRTWHAGLILGLGLSGSHEALPLLRKEFGREDLDVLDSSAIKLRKDEESVRGAIALAVGWIGDSQVVPDLLVAFADKGTSAAFRGHLAVALASIGTDEARKALLEGALASTEVDYQRTRMYALGLAGHPGAGGAILEALTETNHAEVRWAASSALSLTRDSRSLRGVLDQIEIAMAQEGSSSELPYLLLALGNLGDSQAGSVTGATLAGFNYRQSIPLFRTLASY